MDHINSLCRSCFYHLRQLRVIRRTLDMPSASTLIHAFICSRLDYCGSLFAGLPSVRLDKLQMVLRSAARVIAGVTRRDHISDYMMSVLHWLPYPARVEFRVLRAVALSLYGATPSYLSELLHPLSSIPGRPCLRSTTNGLLSVPQARTSMFLKRGFESVGPILWNALDASMRGLATPNSMALFLKRLKTYLFVNIQ